MSHSAGVVISMMPKYYSTEEVVDMLMHCESKDGSSSPATELLESTSKSSDFSSENESKGEMNEEAAGWTSNFRRIIWSPTNTKTLHYVLAATGFILGPTHYAAA